MVEATAIGVGVLLGSVCLFQVALAFGVPWGQHAYGGRARTDAGRLSPRYRAMSAMAVPLLLLSIWVVLARAGVGDDEPRVGWVAVAIWVVVAYLSLNTAANLASTSRIERFVMGSITALAAIGALMVAIGS